MIIRQLFVPPSTATKVTSGKSNTRKRICIHETGNKGKGANADAHARLQYNGNSRQASWHWTVDDKEAVQSFTHNYQCWAAGTAQGNNEAIHIEICVNSDGDYKKAVQNAVELAVKLCKEEGLTERDIVQHNFYSGKNCPEQMRKVTAPIPWTSFIHMVKSNLNAKPQPPQKEDTTLLNDTGRAEIRALLKKAREAKIINDTHTDAKINAYDDVQLLSYQAAVINRTFK